MVIEHTDNPFSNDLSKIDSLSLVFELQNRLSKIDWETYYKTGHEIYIKEDVARHGIELVEKAIVHAESYVRGWSEKEAQNG